ncbi:pyridoxal kinase [endosymbiont of Acanthamoeba sp. UWC8]|uniref:pyridoxal kinase n=1 Tax=endosymbiont of Acanthamoeba sp. UWC8 TaxID=86106 RepID=UPI0006991C8C|nr:pyridoxal kinase [endosymbiont of Acanthamoeba sp. UWC8]
MSIISIQSHVAYGYVGNKAAVYPLQSMGHEVLPINTVQFSNHTGYKKWQGEIFTRDHIRSIIRGIEDIGADKDCQAILSGYMGSREICLEVFETVERFKSKNKHLIYLCDPVIGNTSCYVKPEVLEFFKANLQADIITPNEFEAEILSGIKIKTIKDLKDVAEYFHNRGVKIVVITGLNLRELSESGLYIFVSDQVHTYITRTVEYNFDTPPSGTGDLFSALFLGNYLSTKSAVQSLKRSVYFIDQVIKNTFTAKSRELKIINTNYACINETTLPDAIEV